MTVVLYGATKVQERVVQLQVRVAWEIFNPVGEVVIFSDDQMIFIFDLRDRCLHQLTGEALYSVKPFETVQEDSNSVTVTLRLNFEEDVRMGLLGGQDSANPKAVARMLECSTQHLPTYARVRRFVRRIESKR